MREGALSDGFITTRVVLPSGTAAPMPAVLTLFGEEKSLLALGIAAVTYQVHWELLRGLVPPAPPPDAATRPRTWGKWLLAAPSPHTVGEGYFQLISGDATQTIPQVLDWLATVPEVDMGRIGIVGVSTNGFTALQAAAADRRLDAVVAIAACGDYHTFLARSTLGLGGKEPFEPTPAYGAFLVKQEVIHHPGRLVHAAVLMVNGDADVAVPAACARATARALARAYARARVPERFRFVLIPGGGHDLGDAARWYALGWFQRWLVEPREAAPPRVRRHS